MSMQRVASVWQSVRRRGGDVLVLVAVVAAFVIGFALRGGGSDEGSAAPPAAAASQPAGPQWYTCSMHPDVRMPNPDDKCPICFMSLIPVTDASMLGGGDAPTLTLSPAGAALIDVQTAPVIRRRMAHHVRMVGQIDYDETRLAYITAYVPGRLDRMFVDYTGVEVRKQDHLAEIYSPQLLVAGEELLAAKRAVDRLGEGSGEVARESAQAVLSAARERLRLLGVTPQQIATMEQEGVPGDHVTLYAPTQGVVIQKHARPGSYVKEGDPIYTLADLSRVWVILDAFESDLPWLRFGQTVRFTTQAFGDEAFEGLIAFIDPMLDPRKRTVRVRVNVENPDGRLRPGMFVRAYVAAEIGPGEQITAPDLAGKWISPMHPEIVRDKPGECPVCGMDLVRAEDLGYAGANASGDLPLVVPESAVLRTGERGVVYVKTAGDKPTFEGREVELGPRGDGFFIIRSGLAEGEQVVVRGAFQIDSALQIQARPSMMSPRNGAAATQPTTAPAGPTLHLHGDAAAPIRVLFARYLDLAAALAGDDLPKAKAAAKAVDDAMADAVDADYSDAFTEGWAPHTATLAASRDALTQADDIKSLRAAFERVSDAMIALVRDAHVDGVGPLYRVHCPMAFGNAGASWLSREKTVLNPYFGSAMLRCGSVEETLVAPDTAEDSAHAHE